MKYTKPFSRIGMRDVPTVGGKNASLGEMFRRLKPRHIPIPDGFAVTSAAYWRFVEHGKLKKTIRGVLRGLDVKDLKALAERGAAVRQAFLDAPMPEDLARHIRRAYQNLCQRTRSKRLDVAVRSSATAEDLPSASFAGQQESYLNIRGEEALLVAVRRCFASLFTDRAIVYRLEKGFSHLKVALSVGVQQMVRSDVASAGVMFTIDTESGFRDVVLINAAYGLGESVVQGKVNPDQYYVFKPLLDKGFKPIIGKNLGSKATRIVYGKSEEQPTRTEPVPSATRVKFCLEDREVMQLARWAVEIEKFYSRLAKHAQPMDIEWAKDGRTGKLYIVQARPETVQSGKDAMAMETYVLKKKGELLLTGLSVGSKIGHGAVRIVEDIKHAASFKEGDVLVTGMTDPDWVPIMKRASAIVTESGGRTCHAAIVSRELGTPAVVGAAKATKLLKPGQKITVSCAEGEEGRIYDGILPYEVRRISLKSFKRPRTKVMMNIAEPEAAFEQSFIPCDGVGLARLEFIFSDYIKIHPLALLNYRELKDPRVKHAIDRLTIGYKDKTEYFVDRLAQGIGMLASAFYPREVIVRASDFKTNEYAKLIGGQAYEPAEANPMIGWRGASRYYDPRYRDAFLLECRAFKKVRDQMGLKNLVLMIPFCRTPEEGKKVLATMARAGLKRGKDGLKIYVMAEIPSNVILAEEFADVFDGFSIGSNDLTQLTLGVDRDSSQVSHLYDENNEAVLRFIRHLIGVAKKKKVKIGICGQAPSDFPEFAEMLVREGIDSISLNPDTVLKTTLRILKAEKNLRTRKG